jgi:hypothetical protein
MPVLWAFFACEVFAKVKNLTQLREWAFGLTWSIRAQVVDLDVSNGITADKVR